MAKWFLIAMAVCSAAFGQITIAPEKPKLHDPIVATLSLGQQIPEGAKIRGSWECTTAQWLSPCVGIVPAGTTCNQIYLWAPAGTHVVRASGIWVLTKDVTVGDQTFPVLMDFGQYDYRASVVVSGGGPGPDPPDPPNPGGKFEIVMFYQASQLDKYPQAQRSLLTSRALREKLVGQGHKVLEVLEEAALTTGSQSGPYVDFCKAVTGDPMPRMRKVQSAPGQFRGDEADLPASPHGGYHAHPVVS